MSLHLPIRATTRFGNELGAVIGRRFSGGPERPAVGRLLRSSRGHLAEFSVASGVSEQPPGAFWRTFVIRSPENVRVPRLDTGPGVQRRSGSWLN
jgi:hypothetical protein